MRYEEYLESKKIIMQSSGFNPEEINCKLFDFQQDIVKWSLKKGRSAIFAGTGLGKTAMQLEWANKVCEHSGKNVLILAPLAVSSQTVREGNKFNISVNQCRTQADVCSGINITNYEMLHNFEPSEFAGIVLDESSILKAYDGKTRTQIIESFLNTPYKLACTATPAPNDYMELGNHAEFLGVMTRSEMLSMFFVHDGGDTSKWRLKGHAIESFWQWVSSWAVMLTKPSDLGYEDRGFALPPLNMHQITIKSDKPTDGYLFAIEAQTLQERQAARRSTIRDRVSACAELVNNTDDDWLIWCDLNNESEALSRTIKDSWEIKGGNSNEYKVNTMMGFANGEIKRIISKPSICGYGMNFQVCNKMAFVGLSDSFEQIYQAIRRCWRYGQTKPVDVYMITADTEGAVVKNIERKEKEFNEMLAGMISATQEITRENIKGTIRETTEYNPTQEMIIPEWMVEICA